MNNISNFPTKGNKKLIAQNLKKNRERIKLNRLLERFKKKHPCSDRTYDIFEKNVREYLEGRSDHTFTYLKTIIAESIDSDFNR